MAAPAALAAIGLGATIGGGVASAMGQYQAGQAENAKFQYQAGVAKINQDIKKQDAEYFRDVGEVEAQRSGFATRERVSNIKSTQAGSSVDVNTGSPAAVRESQIDIGQQDARIIRAAAARRAYGSEIEGMNLGTQAEMYKFAGKNAETAGKLKATGTLISTAGNVASKWYGMSSSFGSSGGGTDNPWTPGGPGDASSWNW